MTLLVVIGTRPEAIKLAPVVAALRARPELRVRVVATGQHRRLLDHALAAFDLAVDHDLDAMRPGQQPGELAARLVAALDPLLVHEAPDRVLVQGDTTSALAGALAASWRGVAVAHVEAGLRSGDPTAPFPEELHRRLISRLADLHFAPTEAAAAALRAEGVASDAILVTGNTGIDALLSTWDRVRGRALAELHPALAPFDPPGPPVVLLTAHRRESIGAPLAGIAEGLAAIARSRPIRAAVPVHPNPDVERPLRRALASVPGVTLLPPLPYPALVALLGASQLVLTDSGGLQEEAPALGRHVLVLRDVTERLEGVSVGAATLVGTRPDRIAAEAIRRLDRPDGGAFVGACPYGDGHAASRIAHHLAAASRLRSTG